MIRGFRCGQCRAEVLVTSGPANGLDRRRWSPPVLCCGKPLRQLDTSEVVSPLFARRRACCPQCGYQLLIVVHPAEGFVCQVCQKDFAISSRTQTEHLVPTE